jgi:hypothetical protein
MKIVQWKVSLLSTSVPQLPSSCHLQRSPLLFGFFFCFDTGAWTQDLHLEPLHWLLFL